uniref:Uncharacterized protein n=1 Tax=Sipha flava TaxID=143950 RepID=A0A2S2PV34_9HEMI
MVNRLTFLNTFTEQNVLRAIRQQPTAVELNTGLGQRVHIVRQLEQFQRVDVQIFRAPRLLGRSHFPTKTTLQRQWSHRNQGIGLSRSTEFAVLRARVLDRQSGIRRPIVLERGRNSTAIRRRR